MLTPDRVNFKLPASVRVHKASQQPILGSLRWVSSHLTEHPIPHISIPSSPDLCLLPCHHPAGPLLVQRSHKTTPGSLLTALGRRDPSLRETGAQINLRLHDKLRYKNMWKIYNNVQGFKNFLLMFRDDQCSICICAQQATFPVKPATENSLRILTAVIDGMRHWSQFKDKVPYLFEIFGQLIGSCSCL